MQLTEHYSEEELRVQDAAMEIKGAARILCHEVLEPIRAHFQKPVQITSGRRSPSSNQATGGVKNSQHLYLDGDAAADFDIPGVPADEVFDWIRLGSHLPCDQVILEYAGQIPDIVHVSININRPPRRQAWIGKTHGQSKKYQPAEYRYAQV